jgi:membrane associated rhomboid family serine protease
MGKVTRNSSAELASAARARVRLVGGVVGLLWLEELVDTLVLGGALDALGVVPRTIVGLRGIFFAPFLHSGLGHLAANTLPLVTLGLLATGRTIGDFWRIWSVASVTGGLAAWLLGATGSVHVGASGVIFGMLGYLMARGWYERSAVSMLVSLVVTVSFGGALWGLFPVLAGDHVSWQAHLGGFVGGVLAARRG